MVKVKSISQSQSNYEASAPGVASKYRAGVQNADWATPAGSDEAESLYATQVQNAISRSARQKGIQKVSNSDWQTRASDKGGAQISQAMAKSGSKWARGFQPYSEVLKGITLPARVADPATNVQNRVTPIAVALSEKKKQLQSS